MGYAVVLLIPLASSLLVAGVVGVWYGIKVKEVRKMRGGWDWQ
jgi:hypothetical protein